MIFLRLILTNLLRHRMRTLMSTAGIAFSVAAMLTVVTVLQGAVGMFSGLLSSDSETIVFEKNVSDLFFSEVPQSALDELTKWPMVEHADAVVFGIVSSHDQPIITCFGITDKDARLRKAAWIEGSVAGFKADGQGIVLGERAAEFLHAHRGDTVPVGHGSFEVVGVIRTSNGFEDGGVFMPLKAAQSFFHKEGSSVITVKLRNADELAGFKARVQAQYPNLTALENAEFNRSYSQFRILKATAWAVGGCGLLLGGFGVANTMIMSVFTRIREFAILRVNGFSQAQVATMVLTEASLISLLGAGLGLAGGSSLLVVMKYVPALHGYVDASLRLSVMALVLVLAALTGILGALYPAFYAMRIRAVEALRFE
jgi:putative ABC transport system permease protein